MDIARREAAAGAPEGTVVLAERQTAARGRLRRAWVSPEGNIALSVVFRPTREHLPALTMVAALAVVSSIGQVTGLTAAIKWPNDVLLDDRKVCGILLESSLSGEKVSYAIVGIGINVGLDVAAFPETAEKATSLARECGYEVSRLQLVRALLGALERYYLAPPEAVFGEWRRRLVTLGKAVCITPAAGGASFEAVAETVGADGSLLLRRSDGSLTRVLAGDVTLKATAGQG